MNKYIIQIYVLDKAGVLNKIASTIRRKMYNIDTLTVSNTISSEVSVITLTLQADQSKKISQMIKQIGKIPEVICIENVPLENSYYRELALIKTNLLESKLDSLKETMDIKILFSNDKLDTTIFQIAGTTSEIDSCLEQIGEENIIEFTRTGVTAIEVNNSRINEIKKLLQLGEKINQD